MRSWKLNKLHNLSLTAPEEKTITSIYMKLKNKKYQKYVNVSTRELEAMGINLIEFIDYIVLNGAMEIKKNNYLLLEEI